MSRDQIEGLEFDWFAVDRDGHVGHFATAGYGPVPAAVLARRDEVREVARRILRLPVTGGASGHLPGVIDDWLEMARRGLFSYDWKHWHGPYRRAATPSRPVRVAELPGETRAIIQVVTWPDLSFAASQTVRPEEVCPCG